MGDMAESNKRFLLVQFKRSKVTLPKTNSVPSKIGHPKRKFIFQPSIFGGYVSFREGTSFSIKCFVISNTNPNCKPFSCFVTCRLRNVTMPNHQSSTRWPKNQEKTALGFTKQDDLSSGNKKNLLIFLRRSLIRILAMVCYNDSLIYISVVLTSCINQKPWVFDHCSHIPQCFQCWYYSCSRYLHLHVHHAYFYTLYILCIIYLEPEPICPLFFFQKNVSFPIKTRVIWVTTVYI